MKNYIDLSHTISDGMITYKGLPAPIICDYYSRDASKSFYTHDTNFQIGKIEMVANTGTYIDAPFHRFEEGKDIAELDLNNIAQLEGIVVQAINQQRIDISFFKNYDLKNKAVLVQTNWSKYWGTVQYFENHGFLTKEVAIYLVEQRVKLVGIDSYNIDDTNDGERPVHTVLLGAGIPIVEHLTNLEQLPQNGFLFSAVPPKVKHLGSFPVRAYALLEKY